MMSAFSGYSHICAYLLTECNSFKYKKMFTQHEHDVVTETKLFTRPVNYTNQAIHG